MALVLQFYGYYVKVVIPSRKSVELSVESTENLNFFGIGGSVQVPEIEN